MTAEDAPPPPTLFRITGGGDPSVEEVAALTAAVLQLRARATDTTGVGSPVSRWQYAALREGVGGRPFYGLSDTARIRYLQPDPS